MKFDRITFKPQQFGGRPCIRDMRICVSDVLDMLGDGARIGEILEDFPDLEEEDIRDCLKFAASRIDVPRIAA